MNKGKVWYVTGASQGLGLWLVNKLLQKGYRVAATSRNLSSLQKQIPVVDAARFLPLQVDLTNSSSIYESIRQTVNAFGNIDVIVNNAGYGMEGIVEEMDGQKTADIFNINVMATMLVSKHALPYMRAQKQGHIINVSSVAGFSGAPGWAVYSATKAAVIGFSEVLAQDVKELGIKVTVVAPSGFRTGFLTEGSLVSAVSSIAGYKTVNETHIKYAAMNGKQSGDPEKAADVFIALAESPDPPVHLWLGADAVVRVSKKIESLALEVEQWKALSVSADFPQQQG